MANPIDRRAQLADLIQVLEWLVRVLEVDPKCTWLGHFQECLAWAHTLRVEGFSQGELNDLSASIMSVYGGVGSFNEYVSPIIHDGLTGRRHPIKGAEGFEDARGQVYACALTLRVIGEY